MQRPSANDQSSQAIQAKLDEYKKIASQGTLNPEQQQDFDALVTKLERISEEGQPTPKVSLDIPSSQTKLNGQHQPDSEPLLINKKTKQDVIVPISTDFKDGQIARKKNGSKENLAQPLLGSGARSEQKEVSRAFEYIYRGDYDGLADYLTSGRYQSLSKANTGSTSDEFVIQSEQDTPYNKLPKQDQIQILMEYISRNRKLFKAIKGHGYAGMVGEFLYLWWDFLARVKTYGWYFGRLGLSHPANLWINGLLTFFVGAANFTFSPEAEAKGVLQTTMLNPNKSLFNLIKQNKLLTAAFGFFAVGGSYIEVEQIFDDLDALGPFKSLAIAGIVYAGTSYYALFNFLDIIDGFEKWKNSPTCNVDPAGWDEWITKGFVEFHKGLTIIERCTRIGFGGFKAGQQLSGGSDSVGWSFAIPIGLATIPVALATRANATHEIYYPENVTSVHYASKKLDYERWAQSSWKNRLKSELQLLFHTPTVVLHAPTIYFATKLVGSYIQDPTAKVFAQIASGIVTALAGHGIFRNPTKRATIAEQCVNELLARSPRNDSIKNEPNTAAKVLSWLSNGSDSFASRTMTLAYTLNTLLPYIFNVDSEKGWEMLLTAQALASFIAVSGFRYQVKKTNNAYPSLVPRLFAKRSVLENNYEEPSTGSYEPPTSAHGDTDSREIEPTKVHLIPAGSINS